MTKEHRRAFSSALRGLQARRRSPKSNNPTKGNGSWKVPWEGKGNRFRTPMGRCSNFQCPRPRSSLSRLSCFGRTCLLNLAYCR